MNIQPLEFFEAEDIIKYEMFGLSNATMVPVMITMTPAGMTPLTPQQAPSGPMPNQIGLVSTSSSSSNIGVGATIETQYDASTNTISNSIGGITTSAYNDEQNLMQTTPSSISSSIGQQQFHQQQHPQQQQYHTLQFQPQVNTNSLGLHQSQLIPPGSIIVPASQTAKLTPEQLQQLEMAAANGLVGSGIMYQTLPLPAITPSQQQQTPLGFSTPQQSQMIQTGSINPFEQQQQQQQYNTNCPRHCHILQAQQQKQQQQQQQQLQSQQNNICTATKITQTTKPVTTKNAATITTSTMTILEDENEDDDDDDIDIDSNNRNQLQRGKNIIANENNDDDDDDDDVESNHPNETYSTSCYPKNFSMNGRNNNAFGNSFGRLTPGDFFTNHIEPGCNVGCNALMIMGIGSSSGSNSGNGNNNNRNGNIELNGNTLITTRNRRQSQQQQQMQQQLQQHPQQQQQQQHQYAELQRQSSIIGNPFGNLLDNDNLTTTGMCGNSHISGSGVGGGGGGGIGGVGIGIVDGDNIIVGDNGIYKNETNNTDNDQVKQQLPCNCTYMSFDNFTDYQTTGFGGLPDVTEHSNIKRSTSHQDSISNSESTEISSLQKSSKSKSIKSSSLHNRSSGGGIGSSGSSSSIQSISAKRKFCIFSFTALTALVVCAALATVFVYQLLFMVPSRNSHDERMKIVKKILREIPLIDGHNNLAWNVKKYAHSSLELLDLQKRNHESDHNTVWHRPQWSQTDITRLKEGLVGAQIWSAYVPCEAQGLDAVQLALEQIDIIQRFTDLHATDTELVVTSEEIISTHSRGLIGSLIGIEGGHALGSSLGVLRSFHSLGARYITLTHHCDVTWAGSSSMTMEKGLTNFGKAVIKEMNRLGMLIDLSYSSDATARDVFEATRAPVIYSHSAARALCNSTRNISDDIIRAVAENGGLIMISFDSEYVTCGEPATLHDVVAHIKHIRTIAGIEHIGIGAGYDGIERPPLGLEDVSKYPNLFASLLEDTNWSEEDIAKLAGKNFLRVMESVEHVRDYLKHALQPVETSEPNKKSQCTYMSPS